MLSETLLLNGVYNFSTVVLLIVFSLFSYPPQIHTSPLFARDIVAKRYMSSPPKVILDCTNTWGWIQIVLDISN